MGFVRERWLDTCKIAHVCACLSWSQSQQFDIVLTWSVELRLVRSCLSQQFDIVLTWSVELRCYWRNPDIYYYRDHIFIPSSARFQRAILQSKASNPPISAISGASWPRQVLWENFDIRADRRSAHTRDKLNHRSRTWVCISSDMYTVFYPVAMLCYPEEKDNCLWWESILSTRFWQDLGKSVGHFDFWNRTLQKETVSEYLEKSNIWIFGGAEY